jgi:hypothetical protein
MTKNRGLGDPGPLSSKDLTPHFNKSLRDLTNKYMIYNLYTNKGTQAPKEDTRRTMI